ncbi:MAG: N-acetylglucosamine-6-phosphate deacetylase [Rhodobacteraceae bacterium]|nr:N-acetylglucosamine-6-phosphate deacetylase [Paracoccaceae bacterium]
MSRIREIFAETLYDGESGSALHNRVVHLDGDRICRVEKADPTMARSPGLLATKILAPGFIDIQINGAGDVMFNDAPSLRTIRTMCHAARKGGTAYLLPTFTTASNQSFSKAIDAVRDALREAVPGVLGLHLEGPFLSPEKPGIHPPEFIRPLEADDVALLRRATTGIRLITLAPEEDKIGAVMALASAGWVVFAGHSNATADQMQQAEKQGLSGATHLFNAMSQITVREPGVAGAIINSPTAVAGIIADGHHVHWLNIKMAFDMMGPERLILVTDAMPTLAGQTKRFEIAGNKITLCDGRLVDKNGTLAGAHLAMDQAVQHMVNFLGIDTGDAIKMASAAPAGALGLAGELGKIKPGFRASFTLLDQGLNARGVVVDGHYYQTDELAVEPAEIEQSGGL